MKKLSSFFVFTCFTISCFAQHGSSIKVAYDTAKTFNQNDETADITLHADPRLDAIARKRKELLSGAAGYSGPGFRVQIYSGNDRSKAERVRSEFIHNFPSVRTYIFYVQPQFRVKVGDFRTRGDAQKMYDQAHGICSPCMIVPDYVSILPTNNIPKNDQ